MTRPSASWLLEFGENWPDAAAKQRLTYFYLAVLYHLHYLRVKQNFAEAE